ncbi:MAG: hypothetical protein M1824_002226 [Vezdaea acicularis]|nr:MAG: hypothetical protein M1824_002226 [Vezdaea acicularis]
MRLRCLLLTFTSLVSLSSTYNPDEETPLVLPGDTSRLAGPQTPLSLSGSTSRPVLPQVISSYADGYCDCTGANDTGKDGRAYVCRDPRLGPKRLPRRLPLLSLVSDYDRFGNLTPGDFLKKWTANGYYVYPPQNGFQLNTDGAPILGNLTLQVGTKLDRFGSEYGSYVSAADAPYDQRALPPASLDTNAAAPDFPFSYHVYTVTKPLTVLGGPIAPWFGQPGLGAQFYTGYTGNIMTLINQGYIAKVNKTRIAPGPGPERPCG